MALRLYMDNDSADRRVVAALRSLGIDVLTAFAAGNRDLSDPDQLLFAQGEDRAMYSANVPDFTRIHADWIRGARTHAGILLRTTQSMPVGDQVRALSRICTQLSPAQMHNRIEFIRVWL